MALRLIAIGDLHGEVSLLMRLLAELKLTHEDRLVFLGDYTDRGENSPATIDFLRALSLQVHCIFLRGNHDDMLLDYAVGSKRYPKGLWEQNGGVKTLLQYGKGIPFEHVAFITGTIPLYAMDNVLFVHAGFDPEKTLAEQSTHDLMWIREPWLSRGTLKDFDGLIIHGHTIVRGDDAFQVGNRICIDSGAFESGILSAAILTDNHLEIVRVGPAQTDDATESDPATAA